MNLPTSYTHYIFVLNQVFEIEKKLFSLNAANSISRNTAKIKDYFKSGILRENEGLHVQDPLGEPFDESRTDCEATIIGGEYTELVIIEVIKPIIYLYIGRSQIIIQKGIVIVKSNKNKSNE